jgi:hypothetical protein
MIMKKILLTLACVLGMSTLGLAHSNSVVMLQHNGTITSYEPDNISDALDDAVDGDMIFLSEGTYPMFDIKKQVSIKGAGQLTVIDGDVNILIPDEPELSQTLLSCLKVTGELTIKSPVKRLKISQCTISRLVFNAKTYDSYIDRCHIGYSDLDNTYEETITIDGNSKTYIYPYIKSLTINNSLVDRAEVGAKECLNTTFINCSLAFYNSTRGTFYNCILYRFDTRGGSCTVQDSEVYYSYAYKSITYSNCNISNCYTADEPNELPYDSDVIATNGYLGNDGTIIGPLGGNTPYTLEPTVPHVTKAEMKVDTEKQQLNVTLTVSPK